MDIVNFLEKESALWEKGLKRVQKRRQGWEGFEQKARTYFNSIIIEAKTQKLYESLYVNSSKDSSSDDKNVNYITLFWGQHPTGMIERVGKRKGRMILERGCALHLSQLPSGEVVAIFYPYQSTQSEPPKKYYVYKVYKHPSDIKPKDIQWLVRIMFSLARNSSFARNITFFDHWILLWLRVRTELRTAWHKDWTDFMMNILSKSLDSKIDEVIKDEA